MGFYTTTPDGNKVHIKGDRHMNDKTLKTIQSVFDMAVRRIVANHHNDDMIVEVECDGLDFHTSAAQVARDKARDRRLTASDDTA